MQVRVLIETSKSLAEFRSNEEAICAEHAVGTVLANVLHGNFGNRAAILAYAILETVHDNVKDPNKQALRAAAKTLADCVRAVRAPATGWGKRETDD